MDIVKNPDGSPKIYTVAGTREGDLLTASGLSWLGSEARRFLEGAGNTTSAHQRFVLVECNEAAHSKDVLAEFRRLGVCRPDVADLRRFAGAFPDEPNGYGVACLHPYWHPAPDARARGVIVLLRHREKGRGISMRWLKGRWKGFRFLARYP